MDKYTWVDYGSSYLPSDLNAAYLYAQLEACRDIDARRMSVWELYHRELRPLKEAGLLEQPTVPEYASHNAHMYYIKVKDMDTRSRLIGFLRQREICSVFHYIPLHSAAAGRKFGRFHGEDVYTTRESQRLLRLPMYYSLTLEQAEYVVDCIREFFHFDGPKE